MISRYAAPMFLAEEIQYILDTQEPTVRERMALEDVKSDLENMQDMIRVIDNWQRGKYSSQTLIAGYNLFCSGRGKHKLQD
jgi:hypothetical protein